MLRITTSSARTLCTGGLNPNSPRLTLEGGSKFAGIATDPKSACITKRKRKNNGDKTDSVILTPSEMGSFYELIHV